MAVVNVPEASSRSSRVIKVIKVAVNIKLHFFFSSAWALSDLVSLSKGWY
jgi:hypothetical protein